MSVRHCVDTIEEAIVCFSDTALYENLVVYKNEDTFFCVLVQTLNLDDFSAYTSRHVDRCKCCQHRSTVASVSHRTSVISCVRIDDKVPDCSLTVFRDVSRRSDSVASLLRQCLRYDMSVILTILSSSAPFFGPHSVVLYLARATINKPVALYNLVRTLSNISIILCLTHIVSQNVCICPYLQASGQKRFITVKKK